ncbi:hypothetical protein LMG23992_00361 [Cupriavidus laharis]|uniref:Uncharacterized protein n=1 Tax=Cupriavidus laharis TaxID=151654 RepID=A0ABM8WD34_9BURK|nr:hypothetical protein [Cupriavidus laharis]CAG9165217.1 hypothetical protein LMG23992_00361 [Cupriavidus laharis]
MLHPDLSQQLLASLRIGIQERRLAPMCRLYRRWLNSAQPGDVETLISRCPGELRNNLLVLLHDLLMHFPRAVFGVPCLVQHSWSDPLEGDLFAEGIIALPVATSETAEPVPGLEFIGWAKPGSNFTSTGRQPVLDAVSVMPGGVIGVIALFKASDEGLVYDENASLTDGEQWLSLPDLWWARLMAQVPGNLLLQTHRLMPYPEAVEAARIMCDAAGVEQFGIGRPNFVRQLEIEQVIDKARHFNHLQAQT